MVQAATDATRHRHLRSTTGLARPDQGFDRRFARGGFRPLAGPPDVVRTALGTVDAARLAPTTDARHEVATAPDALERVGRP